MAHWQTYFINLLRYHSLLIIDERVVCGAFKGLWFHKLVIEKVAQNSFRTGFPSKEGVALS